MKINLFFQATVLAAFLARSTHSASSPNGFCGTGIWPLPSRAGNAALSAFSAPPPAADSQAEPVVLDLIALYTPQALNAARNEEDLRNSIRLNVEQANRSFELSGVNVKLNLLYCDQISYNESGRLPTDLSRLIDGQSGLARAHTLRNDFKADLVCLFVEQDVIGIGGQAGDVPTIQGNASAGFTAIRRCMLNYPLVFAHEIGHLLGCQHSREDLPNLNPDDPWQKARFPYVFGNRWSIDGVGYGDIMTYPPAIHYHVFGNPEILMDGVPTGADESSLRPANAARTINQIAPVVANYRSAASRIEFAASAVQVWEANANLVVELRRSGDLSSTTRVTLTFSPSSSAREGEDYLRPNALYVPFAAGQGSAELTIPLLDDTMVEGSESIVLNLSAPIGPHGIGVTSQLVVTILDDEAPLSFTSGQITASEGSGTVSIPIVFHGAPATGESFTAAWHTEDGSALAGTDYEEDSGTLTFSAANEQQTIRVNVLDDTLAEADETFFVVINGLRQEVRIADNDRIGGLLSAAPLALSTASEFREDNGLNVLSRGDGKILVWGSFEALVPEGSAEAPSGSRIALIDETGRLDRAFNAPPILAGHRELPGRLDPPMIHAALPLRDGRVIIGGQFSRVGGEPRLSLACLSATGALETGFNPERSFDGPVYSLAEDSDGRILVAGLFKGTAGHQQACIVRLLPDGTMDSSFRDPDVRDSSGKQYVSTIILQPDGKIIIGGAFTSVGGVTSSNLARLHADGARDATFKIGNGASEQVDALALQRDGRILVAGHFQTFNRRSNRRIVRLNADGSIDPTFKSPDPNGEIRHLLLLPDGRILLGGMFTALGTAPQRFLALLKSDGSADPSCDFGAGPDSILGNDITIAFGEQASGEPFSIGPDGSLYLSGNFRSFNGAPAGPLLRINLGELPPALDIERKGVGLALLVNGFSGARYELERSDNLIAWQSVGSVTLTNYQSAAEMRISPQGTQRGFRARIR